MVARNPHIKKFQAPYLFSEINKRKNALLQKENDAKIINLSIGDTTEPLPPHVANALSTAAKGLGTQKGYTGYGPVKGIFELRESIAKTLYKGCVDSEEIFISDGAKCDLGRLQVFFGSKSSIAVQDPTYPAYADISVIMGQTKNYNPSTDKYDGLVYMPCGPENDFFPDLDSLPRTDLIIFCSPNNPTGATATREQLETLVAFAKKNKSIIIFDTAYASFIQDDALPKTIYEIDGAKQVAIEVGSFSKLAGFTGVRLGWTIIPKELLFDDGSSVHRDWSRMRIAYFCTASNIAQEGGVCVLDATGISEIQKLTSHYLENAQILRKTFENLGIKTYGGDNTPYLWVDFRPWKSWDIFEAILNKTHITSSPGSGFGPSGEGFLRFSAFGSREDIQEASSRLKKILQENLVAFAKP